jgi:hypothetical protein
MRKKMASQLKYSDIISLILIEVYLERSDPPCRNSINFEHSEGFSQLSELNKYLGIPNSAFLYRVFEFREYEEEDFFRSDFNEELCENYFAFIANFSEAPAMFIKVFYFNNSEDIILLEGEEIIQNSENLLQGLGCLIKQKESRFWN